MTSVVTTSLLSRLLDRLNLRFPVLVLTLAAVTVVDFLVPDFIPLADEIGLLLLTAALSRWKARRAPLVPPAPPADGGAASANGGGRHDISR